VILSANDISKATETSASLPGSVSRSGKGSLLHHRTERGRQDDADQCPDGLLKPIRVRCFSRSMTSRHRSRQALPLGMARSSVGEHLSDLHRHGVHQACVVSRQRKSARFYTLLTTTGKLPRSQRRWRTSFTSRTSRDVEARNLPRGTRSSSTSPRPLRSAPKSSSRRATSGVSTSEKNKIMQILIDALEEDGIKSIIRWNMTWTWFSVFRPDYRPPFGKVLADCNPAN